jgi:hypothetical protein
MRRSIPPRLRAPAWLAGRPVYGERGGGRDSGGMA